MFLPTTFAVLFKIITKQPPVTIACNGVFPAEPSISKARCGPCSVATELDELDELESADAAELSAMWHRRLLRIPVPTWPL